MNKNELNGFFDSISPTDQQKERVFGEILKGERKVRNISRKMTIVLAAMLVLVITGVTAMAAVFNWDERLIEYFNATPEQMEKMADSVAQPLATASADGVKLEVMQTITDRHNIYVLYDLTLPEGTELSDDLDFEREELAFEYEINARYDESMGVCAFGTGGSRIINIQGNKMSVLLQRGISGDIKNNQRLTLDIGNLCRYVEVGDQYEPQIVVPFEINTDWSLEYKDTTTVIDVNKKVDAAGHNNNVLTSLEISPMMVTMYIEGDAIPQKAYSPVINMKDGTTTEIMSIENQIDTSYLFSAFQDGRDGGVCCVSYLFDRVTDISEIDNITVGDAVVQIS